MLNRKILVSGISILSALALMGGTAFALFTSAASNNRNTFGSGTLVLNINSVPGGGSTPKFTIANAAPGFFQDQELDLSNTGTVNASSVKITSIAVGGDTILADNLTLTIAVDNNNDGILDGLDTVLGTEHLTNSVWNNYTLPALTLPAGTTAQIVARLTFDSGAGDALQGKSTNFNLNFQANQ